MTIVAIAAFYISFIRKLEEIFQPLGILLLNIK